MIKITLPWPDPILNPNRTEHRLKKQAAKVFARDLGYFEAVEVKPDDLNLGKELSLIVAIYPPDNRKRDADNLLASIKPYIDGVCKGLETDDKYFRMITIKKCEVNEWGKIDLYILELKDGKWT